MQEEQALRAYGLIEQYCALADHHRTGTEADILTVEWFAQNLTDLGADVQVLPYGFERYAAEWELRFDGDEIPSLPLFYEGTGDVTTVEPAREVAAVKGGSFVPDFESRAPELLRSGAKAAVLAGIVESGRLTGVNRFPHQPGSGLPTLCIAGNLQDRMLGAKIDLTLRAEVVQGESANVLALFGHGSFEDRVLLTTPLSGWFKCASERGGGVAACLEVARVLSQECPVAVLGTNGHELMGFGSKVYLREEHPLPAGIFHFGANFVGSALDEGSRSEHPRQLGIRAWLKEKNRGAFEEAFSHLEGRVQVVSDSEAQEPLTWTGEARRWCTLGLPLISLAGGGARGLHHTPQDVPHLATTPKLVGDMVRGCIEASRLLRPLSSGSALRAS